MIRKLAMALLAVFLLTGCAKETFELVRTDTGVISASIKNGQKESSRSVSAVEVDEDSVLVISPDFQKGEVNVVLKDATGNIGLNEVISGRVLSSYEVSPGFYDLTVTVRAKTNGTLNIIVQSKEEFEAVNEALETELEKIEK
ncbi:MAG: hypothetical protein IKE28_03310 [Solobacterium sp.]|nr:hypothetical protein [Solobacterium sp.]